MSASARAQCCDVAVVGASLAGCAAAVLLAREGLQVALVDKRPDPDAYKRLCAHFIQSSALPTLQRLGVLALMEEAGAVRSRFRIRTDWGWISPSGGSTPRCINLRRQLLDPLLRATALNTPGVEPMLGWTLRGVARERERVCGVELRDTHGACRSVRATLVVGADGRGSQVAKLVGLQARELPLARFAYGGYFEGPPWEGHPDAGAWLVDPDWALAAPTDGGLTFYAALPVKQRLQEFRHDPAAALVAYIDALPEPPPIVRSRMVGSLMGTIELPNVVRVPAGPGVALIGDAALATDPLWAVGCGWALLSAQCLADSAAGALHGCEPLERALRRYRRARARDLDPRAGMIHDYARGRPLGWPERTIFRCAAADERAANTLEAFATGHVGPRHMLAGMLPRVVLNASREALS